MKEREAALNSAKEKLVPFPLKTIILAGGRGTRLEPVTGGKIPKCFVPIDSSETIRGIDYLDKVFQENHLFDVVFSADYYYSQYESFANNKPYYSMIYQTENAGNGGSVEQAINEYGYGYQYLVISPDTYFDSKDLNKLITNHQPGTISWGVGEALPIMDSYYGLVVDQKTNAILGDTKLDWWKNWDLAGTKQYVKGAVQIIDPKIFMESLEVFKRLSHKPYPLDLYWDIFPLIEERNRRQITRGDQSFLQAVIFEDLIIDYGTPERLDFTRKNFNFSLN
jgi:NDP-sugar pyrophosphorylase family protein